MKTWKPYVDRHGRFEGMISSDDDRLSFWGGVEPVRDEEWVPAKYVQETEDRIKEELRAYDGWSTCAYQDGLERGRRESRDRIKELEKLLGGWAVFWGYGKADIQIQDLYADTLTALEKARD